ncbi:MAG: Uma2 family endonuclease [Terriglobia bacterium]
MPTVVSPLEERVVLRHVSWETYERLLEDHLDRSSPRFTYDHGVLEIRSPIARHEWFSELVSDLVKLLARTLRIDILSLRSTTFRRRDRERGFEPDCCFYVTHIGQVRGKERIDLATDPPPDIVVEVVVTHSLLDKFAIYSALGIPEVWSYDGNRLRMYRLKAAKYLERPASGALPELAAKQLTEFLELGKTLDSVAWPDEVLKRFRRPKGH